MTILPKRPGPYIVLLLLAVLVIIVAWMFRVVTSPEIREAARERKPGISESADLAPPLPISERPPAMRDLSIDPYLKEISEQIHHPDQPPEQDLEVLEEILSTYRRVAGGNPVGENSDFAAALVGEAPQGVFLSRGSPALRDGALVDRWGTPYWFHPNTALQVEIRSAGPDLQLFTDDDLVINPSPEGYGASLEVTDESR